MPGTVLLLGGSGFIGQALAQTLFAGRAVRIADRVAPTDPQGANVCYTPFDFAAAQDFLPLLRGVDLVVHLISTVAPAEGTENLAGEIADNLFPTLRLLDAMVGLPSPPKLLFVSSGGTVYGEGKRFPLSEQEAPAPICKYAAHKLAIEKYIHLYHVCHGLDYRVARLANPYSARAFLAKRQGAIPIFIELMRRGEPITVWGDGEHRRDYIHIDDALRGIGAILGYDGPERVFNVGTGASVSTNALLALIAEELGVADPDVRHTAARACDVRANRLDIGLLKACTGWEPRISLGEGVRRCVEETGGPF
ncbi:MAG: NAD-dependent epimerase/dehydratase family protein [Clostridia bacterium]|nr:NAD-dependent epimerase/dehydratase family protein [Clostridia bacterium]